MPSDGKVRCIEYPSEGDLMPRSKFVVESAPWAVRFFGTKVSHVYLWMDAAEHASTILDTLKAIEAGEVAPTYNA